MLRKAAAASLILTSFAALALAQQKPNFSGTWIMNTAKSDFGVLPPVESNVSVIDHADPSLKLDVRVKGGTQGGEQHYPLAYTTDGKEALNKMGAREVKSTAAWQGDKLLVTSKFQFNDTDVVMTSTWSLSTEGTTMTQNVHLASGMGETDQKLVFDKAPSGTPADTPAKPADLPAGPKPNFSGVWKLLPAKSDFGVMPPPDSRVDTIEHTEPVLKLTRKETGPQGERNYTLNLTNDGKESANDLGGIVLNISNVWEGSALISTIKLKFQDQDVTVKQVSTLSSDGKILTNKNHLSMAMGEMDQTEVYEKQTP